MRWSTACPDWERRIVAGEPLITFPPLFQAEADAAMDVFRDLVLVDVAGQPTFGQAARPWVLEFAAAIFGAYDHESGRRQIREFLLLIAKKNGKSTLAAGIMLTALIRNWRQSAEFLILAPTREIADNSFHPARDMVRADPQLNDLLHISEFHRTITHRTTGATLRVVAADNETVSGKKATGVLVDELWLFGKKANAESMLLEATGGLASRPEGFVIYLTTHSDEQPAGVFAKKLQYFRAVRSGEREDPRSLPVMYEFPPAMLAAEEFRDERTWHVPNPNLGASVDPDFIRSRIAEAEAGGADGLQSVLAKFLNVEIGLRLARDRWAGADHWAARSDPSLTLDALLDRSDVVVAGIDGGGLDDLLGLAILGRERETRRWLLWNRAWAHEGVLERRKSEAPRLRDLEATGDLVIVSDMAEANDELAGLVAQVHDAGLLAQVGLDLYGPADAVDAMAQHGVAGDDLVVGIQQGWRLNGTIKTIENRLANGTLVHAGQPLMAWCVGNAKVEPRGNAITITKQAAGTAKIDPLVAALCAGALMVRNPEIGTSRIETGFLEV
jgi:phage terminase large subunit-like protein